MTQAHNAEHVNDRCRLYGGRPPCPDCDDSCRTECVGNAQNADYVDHAQSADPVRLAKQVIDVIENIPDDAWADAEQETSTLWRALDEIHEIVTMALLNDGKVCGE